MKQDCLLCDRTSPDNNLYCQEIYCPAEMSPTILDNAEWLGNIEIVKPIIVLRSSVLYEGRQQKKSVLLKVAHPGPENRERLKRETQFLKQVQRGREQNEFLPVLLPPYGTTSAKQTDSDPYGKVVLRGHLLYYAVFEFFEGEPLRDILTKNLQLWVYPIGYIMIRLATAIAFLQSKGMYHYGLSPDCILVYLDQDTNAPSILLFDLGVVSDAQDLRTNWYPFVVHPAYTAPELIEPRTPQPNYATDVYGLGLVLYELLIGEPAFAYRLYSDEEVYDAVRQGRMARMSRTEDVRLAADLAVRAVDANPGARFATAAEMVTKLYEAFGDVPRIGTPWYRSRVTLLVVVALVAIGVIIALGQVGQF